jgi:hypothetical protein
MVAYHDGRRNNTVREGDKLELRLRGGDMSVQATRTNSMVRVQRQLFARSERVKGIDFHPTEPWILTTLYSGMLCLVGGGIVSMC